MNKILLLFITMATFLLSGCSHGRTQYFPKEGNDDTHALVTILRDRGSVGIGVSAKVVLDGRVIAYTRVCEYIKFHVEPGVHSTCLQEALIVMPFEKQKKYYFLSVSSMWEGWVCEQIEQEKFEELLKSKCFDSTKYDELVKSQD